MQTNRPKLPSVKSSQTIIHYHYHYSSTPLAPINTIAGHSILSRAKSDQDIKLSLFSSNIADSDSASSQRSWKKHIRREFQSSIDPKDRIFKGSAREQARQMLTRPYQIIVCEPQSSNQTSQSSFFKTGSNIKASINPRNNNESTLYRPSYFNSSNSSKKSPYHFDDSSLNPEIRKTCITKQSEEDSTFTKLGLLTQRQQSDQDNTYRFALLEEQCAFLRAKFLEHYVRNHQKQHN